MLIESGPCENPSSMLACRSTNKAPEAGKHIRKGAAHSKNENLYSLATAQNKRMPAILVSCEAQFMSNLKKQKNTGPVEDMLCAGPLKIIHRTLFQMDLCLFIIQVL